MARTQTVARLRAKLDAARIGDRAARIVVPAGRDSESGVVPLNPGFFALEAKRAAVKARSKAKAGVRSK